MAWGIHWVLSTSTSFSMPTQPHWRRTPPLSGRSSSSSVTVAAAAVAAVEGGEEILSLASPKQALFIRAISMPSRTTGGAGMKGVGGEGIGPTRR